MKNPSLVTLLLVVLFGCNTNSNKEKPMKYTEVCEGYDAIDLEMLQTIETIESQFKEDKKFLIRFRESQVYWIQYKDRHLRALYPEDWDLYYRKNYGKQVFNACKCQELIRLTELRVQELKWYLGAGPSSQKDCPSHWNKKSPQ